MKQRIISALLMVPFAVFLVIGKIPLLCACIVVSVIALFEFYDGYKAIGIHPSKYIGTAAIIGLYIIIIWGEFMSGRGSVYAHLLLLWGFAVSVLGVAMALFKEDNNILDGPVTSLGVFYIPFFCSHIVLIDRLPRYNLFTYVVFITAFGTDIFAYFSGYFFGKHKLCPKLSPKKTVEGAIGGIIGSIVLCAVFARLVYPELTLHCIILGLLASLFSQAGDLSASAFKRKMGIKDFSNLIPGHGGMLDRIDSVLFTAPFIYYYVIIFIKP